MLSKDEADGAARRLKGAMRTHQRRFSLRDLLRMKSEWLTEEEAQHVMPTVDVTAILVYSPSLEYQLGALLASTVRVQEVWVLLPAESEDGRQLMQTYRHEGRFGSRLHAVESDLFFAGGGNAGEEGGRGGWAFDTGLGRYQLAMQANSDFIWILDPDVIPGRKFLSLLVHVSSSSVEGVFGGAGGIMPAFSSSLWSEESDGGVDVAAPSVLWDGNVLAAITGGNAKEGEIARSEGATAATAAAIAAVSGTSAVEVGGVDVNNTPPVLWPVDVLHSQWFLHRDLIRLMFREKLPARGHCEALSLSYSLKKYAGLQSYVLPYDSRHSDFRPDVGLAGAEAIFAAAMADVASFAAASAAAAKARNSNRSKLASRGRPFPDRREFTKRMRGRAPPTGDERKRGRRSGSRMLSAARPTVDGQGVQGKGEKRSGKSAAGLESQDPEGQAAQKSSPSRFAKVLRSLEFRHRYRDLLARGSSWFWTKAQFSPETMLIVVDGRKQAELLRPMYLEMVREGMARTRAYRAGVERERATDVFIALIVDGYEEQSYSAKTQAVGNKSLPRKAYSECLETASALGLLSTSAGRSRSNPRSSSRRRRTAGAGDDGDNRSSEKRGIAPDEPAGSVHDRQQVGTDALELRGSAVRDGVRGLEGGDNGGDGRMVSGRNGGWSQLKRVVKDILPAGSVDSPAEDRLSGRIPTLEEFCLGDTSRVFHIRVGQDYPRAPGRPLDPFLDMYQELSELLHVVEPTAVAYVAPTTLEAEGATSRSDTAAPVAAAIEAAIRGMGSAPPIGFRLPDAAGGAAAAKALAYLPEGCLELWKKPSIVLVLVHPRGSSAEMLLVTLRCLREAHYLGDGVELRIALHESAIGNHVVGRIMDQFQWTAGLLDITYFGDEAHDSSVLPAVVAALEAFPDPGIHGYTIPFISGAEPVPGFYVWLKFHLFVLCRPPLGRNQVALLGEDFAPQPPPGLPITDSTRPSTSLPAVQTVDSSEVSDRGSRKSVVSGKDGLKVRALTEAEPLDRNNENVPLASVKERGSSSHRVEVSGKDGGNGGVHGKGEKDTTRENEGMAGWESSSVFSVRCRRGMCSDDAGCSRVWMYDDNAWKVLRARCHRALSTMVGAQDEVQREAVGAACALGNLGVVRHDPAGGQLVAKHVSGVGPADGPGVEEVTAGAAWQRVTVWDARGLA